MFFIWFYGFLLFLIFFAFKGFFFSDVNRKLEVNEFSSSENRFGIKALFQKDWKIIEALISSRLVLPKEANQIIEAIFN